MPAREDVWFDSWGDRCAAWLYRPDGASGDVPVVVLAHGWTGIREARLDAFAERFAAAGFAALVFDYRHFGASEGEPRQILDIRRQLADWAAAVAYARTLEGVDPDRVALWGSSFSGGHVITTASRDRRIVAVVAQVPFVDGLAMIPRLGYGHVARLSVEGVRDQVGALAGKPPHMLPSVGPPGSVAVMTSPDAEPGFKAMIPPGVDWPNEAAARVTLQFALYRPIRFASKIQCPILFALGRDDVTTPPDLAERAAARAPKSEVLYYKGAHFDPYVAPLFEQVVEDQVRFFARHVPGVSPGG